MAVLMGVNGVASPTAEYHSTHKDSVLRADAYRVKRFLATLAKPAGPTREDPIAHLQILPTWSEA